MVDPRLALLIFALIVIVLAGLFWPRRGLVARIVHLVRLTERVRLEDTLKHLYNGEYHGDRRSLESVAGALSTSASRALDLIARLEAMGMVRSGSAGLSLTEAGRTEALRVLRSHRLWERYLADRTNVQPADWHDEAEQREHTLSKAEADRLSARMGHPRYDPHGDPIPTAEGEIPPLKGIPLNALEAGETASIVHLEDEPREVYDRLVGEGLAPGMLIAVIDTTPEGIRFTAAGKECTLEPVVGLNVTVLPLPRDPGVTEPVETLTALAPGESAMVVGISPVCQGPQRRRLLDLGVVPGTEIRAEMRSALDDPVAYRIRGALIALRHEQAEWITIHRVPHPVAH
jgi:DtxR family Mn-dependent transcriptional regulator